MNIDRKKFFAGFRERIDASIEQEQVDGLEFLLGQMESDPFWKDIRHVAYALATAGHETAWSFQPVEEGYYLGKARAKRFQKTLRYYPYFGKGYVQLTWKANYAKAGKALGIDLVNNPALALTKEVAYKTMTYGMHQGWFTGKKLSDYIHGQTVDYKNARKIINGTDKAALIAGYAKTFETILKTSAAAPLDKPARIAERDQQTDTPLPSDTPPDLSVNIAEAPKSPPIEVATVSAEPQGSIDTTINKWSSRFVAIPAAALTFLGGVGSWVTESPAQLTVTLVIAGCAIAAIYIIGRQIVTSLREARESKLQREREQRAHAVQLALITAAANKDQNTVTLVAPPPAVEMPNSDAPDPEPTGENL